jgi:hypothetical protein
MRTDFLVGKVKERDLQEDLELDRNILQRVFEKQDWIVWTGFICSG